MARKTLLVVPADVATPSLWFEHGVRGPFLVNQFEREHAVVAALKALMQAPTFYAP